MATEILRPNGVGDLTQFFNLYPGEGESNYENVDDVTPDMGDTYTGAYGDEDFDYTDLYNIQNHSIGVGTINKITVKAVGRGQSDDSTVNFKLCVKTGGTVYKGDEYENTNFVWGTYSQEWALNPKTGLAWAWDDIDALQIGLNAYAVFIEEGSDFTIDQIYLEVDYTETPADVTPPVITRLGNAEVTIEVGSTYTDAGATATDDTDGDITGDIVVGGDTVDEDTLGDYVITYDVSDAASNAATEVTRTVHVVDTTIPVITRLGVSPVTLFAGGTYTDAGATATDNYDGDITSSIVTINPVNTAVAGIYTVTYNVDDLSGNHAVEVTRNVNVVPVAVSDYENPFKIIFY